jgi:hypothetical protein
MADKWFVKMKRKAIQSSIGDSGGKKKRNEMGNRRKLIYSWWYGECGGKVAGNSEFGTRG